METNSNNNGTDLAYTIPEEERIGYFEDLLSYIKIYVGHDSDRVINSIPNDGFKQYQILNVNDQTVVLDYSNLEYRRNMIVTSYDENAKISAAINNVSREVKEFAVAKIKELQDQIYYQSHDKNSRLNYNKFIDYKKILDKSAQYQSQHGISQISQFSEEKQKISDTRKADFTQETLVPNEQILDIEPSEEKPAINNQAPQIPAVELNNQELALVKEILSNMTFYEVPRDLKANEKIVNDQLSQNQKRFKDSRFIKGVDQFKSYIEVDTQNIENFKDSKLYFNPSTKAISDLSNKHDPELFTKCLEIAKKVAVNKSRNSGLTNKELTNISDDIPYKYYTHKLSPIADSEINLAAGELPLRSIGEKSLDRSVNSTILSNIELDLINAMVKKLKFFVVEDEVITGHINVNNQIISNIKKFETQNQNLVKSSQLVDFETENGERARGYIKFSSIKKEEFHEIEEQILFERCLEIAKKVATKKIEKKEIKHESTVNFDTASNDGAYEYSNYIVNAITFDEANLAAGELSLKPLDKKEFEDQVEKIAKQKKIELEANKREAEEAPAKQEALEPKLEDIKKQHEATSQQKLLEIDNKDITDTQKNSNEKFDRKKSQFKKTITLIAASCVMMLASAAIAFSGVGIVALGIAIGATLITSALAGAAIKKNIDDNKVINSSLPPYDRVKEEGEEIKVSGKSLTPEAAQNPRLKQSQTMRL